MNIEIIQQISDILSRTDIEINVQEVMSLVKLWIVIDFLKSFLEAFAIIGVFTILGLLAYKAWDKWFKKEYK